MTSTLSHYLLFAEASRNRKSTQTWRFVLQNLENQRRFSATDREENSSSERLELLAVVRGLEALEGPARVTLVTRSRYVSRGLRFGLIDWKTNDWRWERFGKIVPVRDCDLWQRIDRAMEFHEVTCQTWHFEETGMEPLMSSPEQLAETFSPEPVILPETSHLPYRPREWRANPKPVGQIVGASA